MRTILLLSLCVGWLLGVPGRFVRADDLPAAAKETIEGYEKDLTEIRLKAHGELHKLGDNKATRLKVLQDNYCKEAMLDEAVAVRDLIRQLKENPANVKADNLPPAAKEIVDGINKEAEEIRQRAKQQEDKVREKADAQLKILQDKFCREAKLDEAVAIRDMRRLIQQGVTNAQPDPGYLNAQATDIGKVWYYEVTGSNQDSTWGTDVYTTGSHVGATAVHAGVLRVGQKGIVKVTILPGQNSYESTTRNGVTSAAWGQWHVSFKVEPVSDLVRSAPKKSNP